MEGKENEGPLTAGISPIEPATDGMQNIFHHDSISGIDKASHHGDDAKSYRSEDIKKMYPNARRVQPEKAKPQHNVGQMPHNLHKVKRVLHKIRFT